MFKSNLKICGCRTIRYFRTFSTQPDTYCQVLSDMIGIPSTEAKFYIQKYRLKNKDAELLAQTITFCKGLGYSNKEILAAPTLFTCHPLEIEQHYYSLVEGGFQNVNPRVLSKTRTYMKKIVSYLKNHKLILKSTNVEEKFVSCIEDKEIAGKIQLNSSDGEIWSQIHLDIQKHFLKMRLGGTEEEIDNLLQVHHIIKNKSFKVIQENIKIAEDLGFAPRKLIKYGYLLGNYPNYPKTTLRDLDNIAGIDMRVVMRRYPKLIMTSPKNIIKIYGILKEFDIPDDIIKKTPNVFHMSPETVRVRLQTIEQSPDLKVLLTQPKILALIVHHNRAKTRLSFLQQLQLRCTSFTILRTDQDTVFEEYVKEGKDANKRGDLYNYLQNLFSIPIKDIKSKISRHPFHLQVPLKDMQETYDYLINNQFKPINIYNVIFILLYPKYKVQDAHATIKYDSNFKYKSLTQVNKLNIMLYLIEKEHHFTGNGIWRNNKIPENVSTIN
ncbi:transcription termination factor 5, mitochondrial [Diorhabda sublineata]|uniref:transcription termination factor 5, mitochondrial n=1 Tax=Diorhabda sublineata TaxID=1163346 RepID=UPI0024E143C0|nr:transcription termination factor 5, mitochondrial [Diorhabda sublineata]